MMGPGWSVAKRRRRRTVLLRRRQFARWRMQPGALSSPAGSPFKRRTRNPRWVGTGPSSVGMELSRVVAGGMKKSQASVSPKTNRMASESTGDGDAAGTVHQLRRQMGLHTASAVAQPDGVALSSFDPFGCSCSACSSRDTKREIEVTVVCGRPKRQVSVLKSI